MNSMPEPTQTGDQINDSIRTAAAEALTAWGVASPEDTARLLQSWGRRKEMTDADVVAVLDALFPDPHAVTTKSGGRIPEASIREFARRAADAGFAINPDGDPSYLVERINVLLAEGVEPTPPESEWAEPPACPAWCTGEHRSEQFGEPYRDHESPEMFVPRQEDRVACVNVVSTFNRATGLSTPVVIRVEDLEFNSRYARQLAQLIIRAADLADS
ncbi:hypothetical protein [Actinoplanes subtropicus]|uniref:hypothetical protein n=1 Tax=Actinoplanes subtropicus TaxID=543632 RepID=UPI0004C36169|nr:hypothetical protein [Actinoplanes subtropicus]